MGKTRFDLSRWSNFYHYYRNARSGNDLSLWAFSIGRHSIFFCLLHVARRRFSLMRYHVWLSGFTGVNLGGMRLDISIGSPWHFFFFFFVSTTSQLMVSITSIICASLGGAQHIHYARLDDTWLPCECLSVMKIMAK